MDPNLEAIVAADEECRARVEAAEAAAEARLRTARREAAERRQASRDALQQALATEERQIRSATDLAVVERQALRAKYLEEKGQAADRILAEAAELFARIVRDGRPPVPSR